MAGIFGVVALGPQPRLERGASEALLEEMAARLTHTGHERFERWLDPDAAVAIGHCASPHPEPIAWPSAPAAGQTAWLFDGVLHGSGSASAGPGDEEPEERVRRLGGFFVAIAVRAEPRRVVLAVDRHGSHPLAFTVLGDRLYFAPEAKALLAAPGLRRRLDPSALGLFFGGGYAPAGRTLLAGIDRLRGGELLSIDRDRWHRRPYWEYRLTDAGDGTPTAELERELGALVRAAVARNLARPERCYVLLSGGADSRAIAASAHALLGSSGARLRTVSWTFGEAGPESDEPIARALAAELGSDHAWLPRDVSHYATNFTRLGYILEGLSDTPASHPYEMELIRRMADEGSDCVLRGDECFGWGGAVASVEDALAELGLRRLRGLGRMESLLAPAAFAAWDEAGAAALDEMAEARRGQHPDTARDELYFAHRLQGLLNSISYPKFLVADHRNPLLDEEILAFNARVATPLRRDKQLFRRACARSFPRFWRLPFAKHQNLVAWRAQLSGATPARRFLEAELADDESAVWDYFQRDGVRAWFAELRPASRPAGGTGARRAAREILRGMLRTVPALERRVRGEYRRRVLRVEDFFLRFLTVKAFLDLCYAGDGSRRVFERRLERALAVDASAARAQGGTA